jgi:hypothetical protein
MASPAVMYESDDETEISTCEVDRESPIATTKEALRAFKTVTYCYDTHDSDETLHVSLLSIEKGLQRRLSSSRKQANITDFLN